MGNRITDLICDIFKIVVSALILNIDVSVHGVAAISVKTGRVLEIELCFLKKVNYIVDRKYI